MYPTSERYKELAYNRESILKIYVDGTEINSKYILNFKSAYSLFSSDEFCLGSTPARMIEFKIYKDALPITYKNIYAESVMKIRNDILKVSELNKKKVKDVSNLPVYLFGKQYETISIGHFTLEEINKDDDYTITIKAIDYMIRFEFNYDGSGLINASGGKAKLINVLQDICSKGGVELRFCFFF